MTIPEMITAVQRARGITADGCAGPETWAAIYRALVPPSAATPPRPVKPTLADMSAVDARSEGNIQTLLPEVRPLARALVHMAAQQGIAIKVTSGTRTYAEQDALFKKRPVVTRARGGQSNHNFGIAFDVTVFSGRKPVFESPAYKALGALGRALGLSWGGDWKSFQDEPHFELRPKWAAGQSEREMVAQLRARHDRGEDAFA